MSPLNLLVRIAELELAYDDLRRRLEAVERKKPPAPKRRGPKPQHPEREAWAQARF